MPHSLSAKKSLRQSLRRHEYNKAVKSAVKTQIKKLQHAIEGGNAEQMQQQLRLTAKKLYQAADKGVIHKNLAARKVSQLTRKVNAAQGAASSTPAQG